MSNLTKLKHKINKVKWDIYLRTFVERELNYKNSILLAGSGRSGTTWISDLINYQNEYRYLFEPFNPVRSDWCRGKLTPHKYIRPKNQDKNLLEIAEAILSGKLRGIAIDFYNRKLFYKKRLIKAICANLYLKWLKVNFPSMPDYPITQTSWRCCCFKN